MTLIIKYNYRELYVYMNIEKNELSWWNTDEFFGRRKELFLEKADMGKKITVLEVLSKYVFKFQCFTKIRKCPY